MITTIYIIIISYFILGGIGFYVINRNKPADVAKKSYTKFGTYFIIINALFFSIVINPIVFKYLCVAIIGIGLAELLRLFYKSKQKNKAFFLASLILFSLLSIGLYRFSEIPKNIILFTFLVLSIFDSFSQITGQLWGKTKLFPTISPNKTLGGLVGGTIVATASALLLNSLYNNSPLHIITLAIGIIVFAMLGDLAASYYKRKYKVKDYSNLIPGHGGVLDRFDSLIAGGAWVAVCINLFNF
ncbi:phosphatidate cytidylyltransferase [Saccharicrinis aurantiacus]|uniref:phosphatidate cytidylyltransferase n=1 Tax=Saccharicrinis aurantiacus TaxID=1849719 RepID=UPI0024913C8D|nr:phosphatidate cytidylyltransferase [Saccharicrinis aurantiacus]